MLKKCWGNTHHRFHCDNDTRTMNKQKEIDDQIGGCMEETHKQGNKQNTQTIKQTIQTTKHQNQTT